MKRCPNTLDGARVICYTPIDQRHRFTGACTHRAAGQLLGPMAGLAICHYEAEKEFYLFGCDADWQVITDTWHETLDDARKQAEFEYEGVNRTWIDVA